MDGSCRHRHTQTATASHPDFLHNEATFFSYAWLLQLCCAHHRSKVGWSVFWVIFSWSIPAPNNLKSRAVEYLSIHLKTLEHELTLLPSMIWSNLIFSSLPLTLDKQCLCLGWVFLSHTDCWLGSEVATKKLFNLSPTGLRGQYQKVNIDDLRNRVVTGWLKGRCFWLVKLSNLLGLIGRIKSCAGCS